MAVERQLLRTNRRDLTTAGLSGGASAGNGCERSATSLERRKPSRPRHSPPLLIASDQAASGYLQCLLHGWHLEQDVTFITCPSHNPQTVVEEGLRLGQKKGCRRLFAVVECGSRQLWQQLSKQFASADLPVHLVTVAPSFHLWWLLHFQELTPAIWLDAAQLANWLEQPLPMDVAAILQHKDSLFSLISSKISYALAQARALSQLHNRDNTIPTWTNLQELVDFLHKLRDKRNRLQG
ncbi:hypothetical protein [Candidatus Magnetaquicoccus inordinatus]|uniref:hypothetical protein n=1 Tax=Candidatus Magnetaquicoccus inordinatus TaxID=2496818 RepID=UPI00187D50C9|nr:hypothetical protein [Candidatus Magnetaquicoccus inordinatus]